MPRDTADLLAKLDTALSVTVKQAAELLNISEWMVRKAMREGELPYITFGSTKLPLTEAIRHKLDEARQPREVAEA